MSGIADWLAVLGLERYASAFEDAEIDVPTLSLLTDDDLGDGILAYFGWPKAREDAAECAIHCAFHVRDRIKEITDPSGEPLRCRTGIATGLVVIGGTTGSGNAREDAVAGEVLNLAARLQALADPDGICVSARVHGLVGQLFEFDFAGEHNLRGFDDPSLFRQGMRYPKRGGRILEHENRMLAVPVRTVRTGIVVGFRS